MQRNSTPPGADLALRQTVVYSHGGSGRAHAPRIIHRPALPRHDHRAHEQRLHEEREARRQDGRRHESRAGEAHEHALEHACDHRGPRGRDSGDPRARDPRDHQVHELRGARAHEQRALDPRGPHAHDRRDPRSHDPRDQRARGPLAHDRRAHEARVHESRSWSESPRHGIGPGTLIGNYRVLEPLATGGMGIVFLGEHVHLGRKVALKFLRERLLGDSWAVSRFFAEAVAAARISHPGAVSVFDYGTFEGGAYLVMEYLRGETLSARLERERPLPLAAVLDIGVQLGLTLAAAHDAGVIHRDLKPENIHLVPDPSGSGYDYVKILDFGVAKLTAVSHCCPQTQRGDLLGTPHYMAPEQSVHAGSVDHRCDIYSLGCLLYQLLTGLQPFRGSLMEILLSHQNDAAPSPRAYDPWLPTALDALVRRMMNKSPDGRPASMVEVVRALSAIEREMGACRAQGPTRRRSAAWLGLFFGVGLTIAGLGHLATIW